MERLTMRIFIVLGLCLMGCGLWAEQGKKDNKYITEPYEVPYERPIGFSFNVLGISSMTFEARFLWGLAQNFLLVVSPSYQNTIELPVFHGVEKTVAFFDIRRFNVGAGIRAYFSKYDSRDGWYIETLGRMGKTWIGKDDSAWAVTPSFMVGYQTVYDYGYTVSFGLGGEWEFLLVDKEKMGYHTQYLKSAYYNITKFPLMAELSVGWQWW